ncbi:host nuclease inhibitor GamL, partial [Klebsiella pneumoniae]|nr:host nuclease inhibitor GamL [Klebsiella pneumoniae]
MNAYRAYEVIEERKWAEQTLDEEKEKWIEDRAKEVFDSLPEDPYAALRQSASSRAFPYEGLRSDKAVEVYND